MTWHLDPAMIDRYQQGDLSAALAASLEAHVLACAACRSDLNLAASASRVESNWLAITDAIDVSRRTLLERGLQAIGVRGHVARLAAATPTFRVAWLVALIFVAALPLLAGSDPTLPQSDRGTFIFLVLTPLLPMIGVAAAFGRRFDPAHEITLATPTPGFELLLIRGAGVLATSLPITAIASLALPGRDWTAATWLLPALALTTTSLALARWVSLQAAAAGLGSAWLVAAFASTWGAGVADLVAQFPAFQPRGQLAFLVIALSGATSVVISRNAFDLRRTP